MARPRRSCDGSPVRRAERYAVPQPVPAAAPQHSSGSVFRQRWTDLVFVHWETSPDAVAHLFPKGTQPDVLDGKTYVGLVFFGMLFSTACFDPTGTVSPGPTFGPCG
ncbi:DUF2071 domain-containing protein [Streptomyces showdoensis]|nr:DUF2071 domain-containing protein [Streptomyces showdoensis]